VADRVIVASRQPTGYDLWQPLMDLLLALQGAGSEPGTFAPGNDGRGRTVMPRRDCGMDGGEFGRIVTRCDGWL
jgi:hypothetical protein